MGDRQVKNTIIIFNEYTYKEIDLDSYRKDEILISNTSECDIKINMTTDKWFMKLVKEGNNWLLQEPDGVYYIVNNIKINKKKLIHGDEIIIKSLDKEELFKMNFFLDFSSGKENYDKGISLEGLREVKFGRGQDNTILIDDPLVNEYHCIIKLEGEKAYLIDLDSKYSVYIDGEKVYNREELKDNDFIIICGYKFLYKENKLFFSNYNDKIIVKLSNIKLDKNEDALLTYPEFSRTPRFIYKLPDTEVEIVAPPKTDKKQSVVDALVGIIPMIGMAGLAVTMGMGSNKFYRIGMVAITICSSVLVLIINNKRVKNKTKKRNKMYLEYIDKKDKEILSLYEEQKKTMELLYPTVDEAIDTIYEFKRRLWEKSSVDSDYLQVFIGKGIVDISFKIKIPKEEFGEREDDLLLLPNELHDKYNKITDMPITLDLKKHKAIGIIGSGDINKFIKNIIVEVVAFHYYEDVNIICAIDEADEEEWKWARWLPHLWDSSKKLRFMGVGKESSHYVLTCLNDILKQRIELAKKNNNGLNYKPHYIMVITEQTLLENEEISTILESGLDLGITVIYAYKDLKVIPKTCSCIIDLKGNGQGSLTIVNEGNKSTEFKYKEFEDKNYEDISRRLAPVYVKKMYSENTLPKCITLYELLGVKSAKQFNLLDNWKKNDVCKTMAAPLGVNSSGEILELNLHEKFHGPHGLVAGTTGSGKSEIIQSYIISLAINYHPYDVSFILIDYKGGGMANLFSDLPHLIGTITNLDGNLVNRSLSLIKSELKRRQRIFSKYDVNHINGYKMLEKQNSELEPLPHLIIIADEFAELKTDQPEFMKELVSTARIGRSLGVHLILATQKPTGVVDSQIWSNSKFKLCLKVQDASDSNELLKKPDAASIVEPGRAYFQVGNNEIYQLFQSAWSGAKKYIDDDISNDDIEISQVSIEGRRKVIYSSKDNNKGKEQITQLDETINQINKVFFSNGFKRVDDCWIPPLEEVIYIKDIIKEESYFYNVEQVIDNEINPIVGIVDCPNDQVQLPMRYNLSKDGNLLIIGGSGYGKTTFIQTLILSLSLNYSPKDVNIYALDFGTRTLKVFENMPHVGDVILSDDEEKIYNLFKVLRKEILKRKTLFSEVGASSLGSYKLATNKIMPQIIVIIDNYIAFKELYDSLQDEILFLSREGTVLGISIILTNPSTNGLNYKLLGNFKNKLVFTCIDKSEYMNVFSGNRTMPTNLKGRALVNFNGINEAQMAICGDESTVQEFERTKAIRDIIEDINMNYSGRGAAKIPTTPEVIYIENMLKEIAIDEEEELTVPCGFSSENLENIVVSIAKYPLFTLVGESKSGRTNMMKNILYTCKNYWNSTEFVIFDTPNSGLATFNNENIIKMQGTTKEEYSEMLSYILLELNKRRSGTGNNSKLIILIDNINEIIKNLERKEVDKLEEIAKEGKGYNISMIIAGTDSDIKTNVYSVRFLKVMKEAQAGIVFDSLNSQNFFNARLKYSVKEAEIKKGDGYLVLNNRFCRIKTPKSIC